MTHALDSHHRSRHDSSWQVEWVPQGNPARLEVPAGASVPARLVDWLAHKTEPFLIAAQIADRYLPEPVPEDELCTVLQAHPAFVTAVPRAAGGPPLFWSTKGLALALYHRFLRWCLVAAAEDVDGFRLGRCCWRGWAST